MHDAWLHGSLQARRLVFESVVGGSHNPPLRTLTAIRTPMMVAISLCSLIRNPAPPTVLPCLAATRTPRRPSMPSSTSPSQRTSQGHTYSDRRSRAVRQGRTKTRLGTKAALMSPLGEPLALDRNGRVCSCRPGDCEQKAEAPFDWWDMVHTGNVTLAWPYCMFQKVMPS